jgi:hypothetical protein
MIIFITCKVPNNNLRIDYYQLKDKIFINEIKKGLFSVK